MTDTEDQDIFDSDEVMFLTVENIIELHNDVIAEFTPGERCTILNRNLLESAVMTPQQSFGGQPLYPAIEGAAAAYMAGLAANHAFENGNKRIALAAGSTFLRMNGYKLILNQEDAEMLILDLVTHVIDREQASAIILNGMDLL